jgi:aspartate/methionine/tyrosine aminotransferase
VPQTASTIPSIPDLLTGLRPEALSVPESGIVEVYNYGNGRQGLIPMWSGESDIATPAFICDTATRALAAGETFYTHQGGIPELREAIARYMTRVYGALPGGAPFGPERFFVTVGGMQALELAMRMIAGAGDEVIVPTPAWPNFAAAIGVNGAVARQVAMSFQGAGDAARWTLDLGRLEAAVNGRTRCIVINSPSNPLGWTATREEIAAVLDIARRRNLWIVADEIYGRLVYTPERAPSFHDVMAADDKILFVQTLSKNWAMTGWRLGWLEAPPQLGEMIENLIQYSTSGVPVFAQRAAVTALDQGEALIAHQLARITQSRDILCKALAATGRVQFARPPGAFYLFCRIAGEPDTRALCMRLVDEAGIGLAPGSAFGEGGRDYVRICFARAPDQVAEAARRLTGWLTQR